MSFAVLLAENLILEIELSGLVPAQSYLNERSEAGGIVIVDRRDHRPTGRVVYREESGRHSSRIGVPLTSADHRHAVASTVTRRFLVSILTGVAAGAGRQ